MSERASAPSEGLRADSVELHRLDSGQVLDLFESDARSVAAALESARAEIAALGEAMRDVLEGGGRVLYFGAGTSGRIGALDAAEWPPTFGIAANRIVGCIAGGPAALSSAVEGAEDDSEATRTDVERLAASAKDLWVGISASGSAAYVREAMRFAREIGARRALITANPSVLSEDSALIAVRLDTGAEVLAGSTRLKAATATHQVLQRASNVCAVGSGWVYAGRMVEMRPTNLKLRDRAERIVEELGGIDRERAAALLRDCDDDIKRALVVARCDVTPSEARSVLERVGRRLTELPEFP